MKKALQFVNKQALLWCLFLISGVMWGQDTYTLVTQASDLVAGGKYLVSNGTSNGAVSLLGPQATNNRTAVAGAVSTNSIAAIAATASSDSKPFEITLGGSSGAWTLTDAVNGTLLGPATGNNSNNHLKANAGTPLYTISFSGNAAVMTCYGSQSNTNNRNIIRFNTNLFASYASGQAAVYLFKKNEAAPTQTATPTFSFSGTPISTDTYANSTTATLSTSTSGATIYYTVDGSTPTSSSSTYIAPFNISSTTTIKALATFTGLTNSAIATRTITIVNPPANDLCANAIELISNNPATNGTLANASVSSPFSGSVDVWYKITPTYNETYTFTTSGFTDDVDVYLYNQSNACPSSTTFVTRAFTLNNPEVFTSALVSGVTYYVRLAAESIAAQNSFTIQVTSIAPVAPTVTPATVNGNVGTSVNYQIVASNAPTVYAIATGTLPTGLSLNTTSGVISGTPTTAGNSSVTVTATNTTGTSNPAALNFEVAKGTQTITFAALANRQYGSTEFNLTATSSAGTTIVYESSNTSVANIFGNTVTIVGVGTTEITASQTGNANYNAAANVVRSLTVTPRIIALSGLSGEDKTYDATTTATVSGGASLNGVLLEDIANVSLNGTPSYTFADATVGLNKPITVSGYILTGSASNKYALAAVTGVSANITAKTITITGATAQNKVYDAGTVATIDGGVLTGVEAPDTANVSISTTGVFASANVGTGIAVTVSLTGSATLNYALTQPGLTADITKADQTITFNALPTLNTSSSSVNLNTFASATSGLALIYESSNLDVVTISGNTLTVVGVGTAVITASQAGDSNYNAALDATQNVTVSLVPIVIAQFDFDSFNASLAPQVTTKNINVIVTDFAVSSGTLTTGQTTGTNFPNEPFVAGNGDWTATNQATAKNFNFNVTASQGYAIEVTSFEFNGLATSAGPSAMSFNIASGLSSFTANAPDGSLVTLNQTISGVNNLTTIPVLIQGWLNGSRPSAGTGVFRIDDVILKGYVTCIKPTAFNITGGGAICGTETASINLSGSEVGMNYQLKIDGVDSGASVAGTGSALVFTSQSTIGTYTIVATNQFCSSSTAMTGNATITEGICATIWTITLPAETPAWTNGAPTALIDAIIADDYNETESITAKNLTIASDKVLTIQAANTLTVAGNLTNNGSIVFQSNETGTASFAEYTGAALAGSGTATVERYIPAKRAWRAVTAPLKGSNGSLFATWQNNGALIPDTGLEIWGPTGTGLAVGPSYSALEYTSAGYAGVANTETTNLFDTNKNNAYLIFVTGSYGSENIANTVDAEATTLKATGQLITGDVTTSGIISTRHTMIGNPYASPLNPATLLDNSTDLINKFWVWDSNLGTAGGAYVMFDDTAGTYSNIEGSYPDSATAIQSGQAFFVRATTGSTGSLTLKENSKSNAVTNAVFSTNTPEIFRLGMYRQQAQTWVPLDGAIAVMYPSANPEVDANDGRKFANSGENIAFRRSNISLSSEHHLPLVAQDTLYFRVWNTTPNTYKLHLNTESFTTTGLIATLQDLYTNTNTVLNLNGTTNEYVFTVNASAASTNDRFRIVFGADESLGNNNPTKSPFIIAPNPVTNQIVTISSTDNQYQNVHYTLVNTLGQIVSKGTLNADNTINVANVAAGMYIMKLQTENNEVYTSKLIIK